MYKEKLRNLKREIILETRKYLLNRKIESLRMTSPFKIHCELKIAGDYVMVPLIVEGVDIYGKVDTHDTNDDPWDIYLEELDVYDLAHLHEQVIKNSYTIINYLEETEESSV